MKLPKTLYVHIDHPVHGDPYLLASQKVEIDDDGPTEVGVYKLVEKRSVRKRLEQTTKR